MSAQNALKSREHFAWAVLVVSVAFLLAGCAADAPSSGAPTGTTNSLADREVACLHDAGYDATVTWDGGVMGPTDLPSAQFESYMKADRACSAQVGSDNLTLNVTQLSQLYDQELVERVCLIGRGYGVDDAPSRQTFIDTWDTGARWAAWDASDAFDSQGFDDDSAKSQELQKQLALLCPPPAWFLAFDGLG